MPFVRPKTDIPTIIFLSIILFSLITGTKAQAQDFQPFKIAELKNESLCRYVSPRINDGHRGKPTLFRNIKNIYIAVSTVGLTSKEIKESGFLTTETLELLSGCTLGEFLSPYPSEAAAVTIYAPEGNIYKWVDKAAQDDNLIVTILASLTTGKGLYEDLFDDKIIVIDFTFYRSNARSFDDARYGHCSQAFPYTDNEDALLQRITKALHGCLDQEYH